MRYASNTHDLFLSVLSFVLEIPSMRVPRPIPKVFMILLSHDWRLKRRRFWLKISSSMGFVSVSMSLSNGCINGVYLKLHAWSIPGVACVQNGGHSSRPCFCSWPEKHTHIRLFVLLLGDLPPTPKVSPPKGWEAIPGPSCLIHVD